MESVGLRVKNRGCRVESKGGRVILENCLRVQSSTFG